MRIENRIQEGKPIYRDTLLECVVDAWDLDDGSNLQKQFVWEKLTTGQIIGQSELLQLSAALAVGGDVISCQVEVIDTIGDSSFQTIYARGIDGTHLCRGGDDFLIGTAYSRCFGV